MIADKIKVMVLGREETSVIERNKCGKGTKGSYFGVLSTWDLINE